MGWNLGVLHDQHQPLKFSWASSTTLNIMVCHLLHETNITGGKESALNMMHANVRVYASDGMRERERVTIREP